MLDLIKPKLVFLDTPLFMALLADLFPGVEAPPPGEGPLRAAVEAELREAGLQVGGGVGRVDAVRSGGRGQARTTSVGSITPSVSWREPQPRPPC